MGWLHMVQRMTVRCSGAAVILKRTRIIGQLPQGEPTGCKRRYT